MKTNKMSLFSGLFAACLVLSLQVSFADEQFLGFKSSELCIKHMTELQEIVDADQADRKSLELSKQIILRDQKRRMRVGELFGEGCFRESKDYAAAALVFQHGETSDHFFQAFLWAKQAVDLGDSSQQKLMVMAIDRYLLNKGQKQLFATQIIKFENDPCWCLQPVEKSFPESKRKKVTGKGLEDVVHYIRSLNSELKCSKPVECVKNLKPTPRGSIPGFW